MPLFISCSIPATLSILCSHLQQKLKNIVYFMIGKVFLDRIVKNVLAKLTVYTFSLKPIDYGHFCV